MAANLNNPTNFSTYIGLSWSISPSSASLGEWFVSYRFALQRLRVSSSGTLIPGETQVLLTSGSWSTTAPRTGSFNDSSVVLGQYYKYTLSVTTRYRREIADGRWDFPEITETSFHIIQRYVGNSRVRARDVMIDKDVPLTKLNVTFTAAEVNASEAVVKYDIRAKNYYLGNSGILNEYVDNPISDSDWEMTVTPSWSGTVTKSLYITDSYTGYSGWATRGTKKFLKVFTYAYSPFNMTEAHVDTPVFTWENVPNQVLGVTCTNNQYNGVLIRWTNDNTTKISSRISYVAVYRNGGLIATVEAALREYLDVGAPVGTSSYQLRFALVDPDDVLYGPASATVSGTRLAYPARPDLPIVPSSALLKNGLFAIGPAGMSISGLETGSVHLRSTDQTLQCVYRETITLASEGTVFTLSAGIKNYLTARYMYIIVAEKNDGNKRGLANRYYERLSSRMGAGGGQTTAKKMEGYSFNGSAYFTGQNTLNTDISFRKVTFYFFNVNAVGFTSNVVPDTLSGQVLLDSNRFIVGGVDYSSRMVVSTVDATGGQLVRSLNYADDIIPTGDLLVDGGYFADSNGVALQILGSSGGSGWEFDLPNGIVRRGGHAWWHGGFGRNRCAVKQVVNLTIPRAYGKYAIGPWTRGFGEGPFTEYYFDGTTTWDCQEGTNNTLVQVPINFTSYPSGAIYCLSITPSRGGEFYGDVYFSESKSATLWTPLAEGAWYHAYTYEMTTTGAVSWLQGEPLPRAFIHNLCKLYIGRFGNQLRTRYVTRTEAHNGYASSTLTYGTVYHPEFKISAVQIA